MSVRLVPLAVQDRLALRRPRWARMPALCCRAAPRGAATGSDGAAEVQLTIAEAGG